MHGGPKTLHKTKQHEKAMSANVNNEPDYDTDLEKRAREAGL